MLHFEPRFFEAETREGFLVEPLVKNAWAAQLETLHMFDKICEENNLTYSADWGTLLGAVRHGGYIPWDDDLDVCMPRADLMKFYDVIDNYPKLRCFNVYNTQDFGLHATRLNLSRDFTTDRDRLKDYHGFPFPVGIDIFSIDNVPRKKEQENKQIEIMKRINYAINMMSLINEHNHRENEYRSKFRNYIREIKDVASIEFKEKWPNLQELSILYDETESIYSEEQASYVTEYQCIGAGRDYYLPKDTYKNIIRLPFENIMICVPANYNDVLIKKYGNNYMKPVLNTANHEYPFFNRAIQDAMIKNGSNDFESTKNHIEKMSSVFYKNFVNRDIHRKVDIDEQIIQDDRIRQIQSALLEVLEEINRLCREHNLQYYLIGETIEELDKIRAFSSESTDIHIAMKRDEYMRFINVIQEELDAWFDYRSIYTHPEHTDMRTYIITDAYGTDEGEYEQRFHGCSDIVGIDIAPIDSVSDDDSVEELKRTIITKLVQSLDSLGTEPPYDVTTIALVNQWQDILNMEINMQGDLRNEFIKAADSVAMSDNNASYNRVRISSDIAEGNYRLYDKSEF